MDALDTTKSAILRARELTQLSRSTCDKARELVRRAKLLQQQIEYGKATLEKLKAQRSPANQAFEDWALAFLMAGLRAALPRVSARCSCVFF